MSTNEQDNPYNDIFFNEDENTKNSSSNIETYETVVPIGFITHDFDRLFKKAIKEITQENNEVNEYSYATTSNKYSFTEEQLEFLKGELRNYFDYYINDFFLIHGGARLLEVLGIDLTDEKFLTDFYKRTICSFIEQDKEILNNSERLVKNSGILPTSKEKTTQEINEEFTTLRRNLLDDGISIDIDIDNETGILEFNKLDLYNLFSEVYNCKYSVIPIQLCKNQRVKEFLFYYYQNKSKEDPVVWFINRPSACIIPIGVGEEQTILVKTNLIGKNIPDNEIFEKIYNHIKKHNTSDQIIFIYDIINQSLWSGEQSLLIIWTSINKTS